MNRVQAHIDSLQAKVAALSKEKHDGLDASMAVEPFEHFAYQQAQARAHVSGKLTAAEAQVVYVALGEHGSVSNGGWAKGTDLATKVSVTMLMKELVTMQMLMRAARHSTATVR